MKKMATLALALFYFIPVQANVEEDYLEVVQLTESLLSALASNDQVQLRSLSISRNDLKEYYIKFENGNPKKLERLHKVYADWNDYRAELFAYAAEHYRETIGNDTPSLQKVKFSKYDDKGIATYTFKAKSESGVFLSEDILVIKTQTGWKLFAPDPLCAGCW